MINGVINPTVVQLCSGRSINITVTAPGIFDDYHGASLMRGETVQTCVSKCCALGSILTNSVVYQCRDMDIVDSGSYRGHFLLTCGRNKNVEWYTPVVMIIVKNCSIGGLEFVKDSDY